MMNKFKLFIFTLLMVLSFSLVSLVKVDASQSGSVYQITDTTYDEETGKLAYQKVSYHENTFETLNTTTLDAAGNSMGVSDDAEYVFYPAEYLDFTSDTKVSFKYRNNGVKKIVVLAEYAAGVTSGGVDYNEGAFIICMNALNKDESWNLSFGKAIDGESIFTIIFGSYAQTIYDVTFTGFRLYFDYGVNVTEERSFEVLGYEIHESSAVPTFTTDPKSTRVGKLKSEDVVIENNMFTVDGNAKVTADILDSKEGYEYLSITFRVKNDATITFKLDDETKVSKKYEAGNHTVNLALNQKAYNKLEMLFEAENTLVIIKSMSFKGQPYVTPFSGKVHTITTNNGVTKVTYTYEVSWEQITATVKEYNDDYDTLIIELKLYQPTLLGILIDGKYVVNHWDGAVSDAGTYKFEFDTVKHAITSDTVIDIYLDPGKGIGNYVGTPGTKQVDILRAEFVKAPVLPEATVTVDPLFEFDYDGKTKQASGATTNSGSEIYYEYKLEGLSDKYYDTTLPKDAGTYDVRAVSPRNDSYATTYAYSKLVINKVNAPVPTSNILTIDYLNSKVNYDDTKYIVGLDSGFINVVKNGGYVIPGTKLYYKALETANVYESEVGSLTLSKNTNTVSYTINYKRQKSVEKIPTNVEYSIDGINWTQGKNGVINLVAGNIYMFREMATETQFAGEIFYLPVPPRSPFVAEVTVEATTPTSVTLTSIPGAEYRFGDSVYTDSNVLTEENITPGSTVFVYVQMKATSTSYPSEEVVFKLTLGDLSSVVKYDPYADDYVEESQPYVPDVKEPVVQVESLEGKTYIVKSYLELSSALKNTNNVTMTYIIIDGSIHLEGSLTVSGKVTLMGNGNSELVFENNGVKYSIKNTKGADLRLENLTVKRSVINDTQTYLFNFGENGNLTFTDVFFDIATSADGVNSDVDRITYCPSGVALNILFNNCTYNTDAFFYRGDMIFINCKTLPKTMSTYSVNDFSKFKLNYDTKTFRFPSTYKVCLDEDFTEELILSGTKILSNTTYYVKNGDVVFSVTTKNLKLAKPTIDDLTIDYVANKVYFSDKLMVCLDSAMTEELTSGTTVTPGLTLYVKHLAEDIYFESDVAVITLPMKPAAIELETAYVCSFGFVMQYYENAFYSIDGVVQNSPVFVGLESGTTYTVTVYIGATDSSFNSLTYQTTVTIE